MATLYIAQSQRQASRGIRLHETRNSTAATTMQVRGGSVLVARLRTCRMYVAAGCFASRSLRRGNVSQSKLNSCCTVPLYQGTSRASGNSVQCQPCASMQPPAKQFRYQNESRHLCAGASTLSPPTATGMSVASTAAIGGGQGTPAAARMPGSRLTTASCAALACTGAVKNRQRHGCVRGGIVRVKAASEITPGPGSCQFETGQLKWGTAALKTLYAAFLMQPP